MSDHEHRQRQNRGRAEALQRRKQAAKADAWARRDEIMAPIREAGFEVRLMSETSRHLRIMVPGYGWFDFWPSSGRWSANIRRQGGTGDGVGTLLTALQECAR